MRGYTEADECRHGASEDCPACAEEMIAKVQARIEALEAALRKIDVIISRWELTMCLPGPKEVKQVWYIARAALDEDARE